MESNKNPQCELFEECAEINIFPYTDQPIGEEQGILLRKTFDNLEENSSAIWLLLAPLDLLTEEKSELPDKINQLLAFQYTVTMENNELCDAVSDVHKQCKGF